MKRGGSQLSKPVVVEGMPDMTFDCSFSVAGVNSPVISQWVSACPSDLADFWTIASTARLFEDISYGQWGLEILDPQAAATATKKYQSRRHEDFLAGDLVIGKFLGDSDLLIIRCDPACSDFGSILVALPIDRRNEWYKVADSLSSFLDIFIKASGDKVWAVS